jgi:hypothetical protein
MDSVTQALQTFHASVERFAAALDGVGDTTWVFKPSRSVWSIAEVIEHVTRLTFEHPIFGLLDGVQWLLFAASHHDNHTRDLLELRELASAATR